MDIERFFPEHKGSLMITHNDHKSCYQTVVEWVANEADFCADLNWVSLKEKENAIATNELWSIQWYPDSPVGFFVRFASTLDALMSSFAFNTGEALDADAERKKRDGGMS